MNHFIILGYFIVLIIGSFPVYIGFKFLNEHQKISDLKFKIILSILILTPIFLITFYLYKLFK
jgi:ABC-type transport system involved in cytochrome bd biosynthesis fused ATPase/permease subunit